MYGRTVHVVRPTDRVRTVMMWPVATVETVATLSEVAEALAADEVGALCVVENDALAGIVSERDVVTHLAAGGDPAHLTAGEVMSGDLLTIGPDATLVEAARTMRDGQVRHLPVLSDGSDRGDGVDARPVRGPGRRHRRRGRRGGGPERDARHGGRGLTLVVQPSSAHSWAWMFLTDRIDAAARLFSDAGTPGSVSSRGASYTRVAP